VRGTASVAPQHRRCPRPPPRPRRLPPTRARVILSVAQMQCIRDSVANATVRDAGQESRPARRTQDHGSSSKAVRLTVCRYSDATYLRRREVWCPPPRLDLTTTLVSEAVRVGQLARHSGCSHGSATVGGSKRRSDTRQASAVDESSHTQQDPATRPECGHLLTRNRVYPAAITAAVAAAAVTRRRRPPPWPNGRLIQAAIAAPSKPHQRSYAAQKGQCRTRDCKLVYQGVSRWWC
jgi:hypothetical protein